jgi:amino acid adenylation domain-containing protein
VARSEEEISDFVRVFCAAYRTQGSQYHALFAQVLRAGEHASRTDHYLAYAEGRPVAIATLASRGRLACIYNVGTSPLARKRGFAASLLSRIIDDSLAAAHQHLFLQAETGSPAERLYLRLGFETAFVRTGYGLANWSPGPAANREPSSWQSAQPAVGFLADIWRQGVPPESSPEYAVESVACPSGLLDGVETFCGRFNTSPEALWVAAWAIVLSRYSHEAQICLGLRVADTEGLGHAFPRPLRVEIDEQSQVAALLAAVQRSIAAELAAPRNRANQTRNELFDTVVNLAAPGALPKPTCPLEWTIPTTQTPDLVLAYERGRIELSAVRRLAGHLFTVTMELVTQATPWVGSIELLSPGERQQLLVDWNKSDEAQNEYVPIHRLIEAQAGKTPQALAVKLAGSVPAPGALVELSYGDLNARANQLARYLQSRGLKRAAVVGIFMERSVDMIVALIGIFKAGATCLPLEPASPKERLEFIVADAQVEFVLGHSAALAAFPECDAKLVAVDGEADAIATAGAENLTASSSLDNPAYIIYTSGSTGKPKGVVVPHRAIATHCLEASGFYQLRPSDRVLQFNSISFDAAFEQILPTLISGAALLIRGPEVWTVSEFGARVRDCGLTVVDLPTAYWHQVLQEWCANPSSVPGRLPRLFIVGGEAMSAQSLALWRQLPIQDVRLVNAYGPTEATITATAFEVTPEYLKTLPHRVPIGRPRGGRKAYVLDRFARPVPVGVRGELYLGGPLLALGYLNRPELTNEKFIPNPLPVEGAERLYKTGDLVRYLPDGTLEFLGRVDDQVKIRGYRVELGEIESALKQHPDLRDSIVILREEAGHPHLAAYVVSRNGHVPSAHALREFLGAKLPAYMVPASFVTMKELPLLPGGKVDRRALPAGHSEPAEPAITGPRDANELRVQLLFERILKRGDIGVDVSFFELGGDSLQALELIVELERMSGRTLPLGTLYQTSSVADLARLLQDGSASVEGSALVPLQTGGSRRPVFLIHTTPGDILGYGNLIYHLDPAQPCYGLQSLGLLRPELRHSAIDEMAAYYVGQVRSVEPEGPYYLAGWCYGGIVALEMAQQLLALGESVAFLGLLETIAPAPSLRVYQYYLHRIGRLLQMRPRQWQRYFASKIRYYRQVRLANRMRFRRLEKLDGGDAAFLEEHNRKLAKLEQVYNTNLAALNLYQPRPYAGRVTLFNAEEVDPGIIADPQYAWPGLTVDIEVHAVPGDHDTMLMEPNVAVLAQKLDACLRRAQQDSVAHGSARARKPVACAG